MIARACAGERVVWKFGGTSVGDLDRLRAVAARLVAARRQGLQVVAVLSAMGDATDELDRLAYSLSAQPPPRELDALLALGENETCALAAIAIHELGEGALSLTGAQAGVRTDDAHGSARLRAIDPARIVAALRDGVIVLVAGFQGQSAIGDVTTLGRGGSDATAIALAAALDVPRCEIFTDVAGVFTADPRAVPGARQLAHLDFDEMLQLAEAGARVLQPRAVELAAAHGVDIHVRSSFTAESGTLIRETQVFDAPRVAGVAHRRHDPVYTAGGLSPAAVASALAGRGAAVGSILREGDRVRFTAPGADRAHVLAAIGGAGVRDDLGSVSVVCTSLGSRPEIAATVLDALERSGIEVHLVTNASGRVSCHVAAPAVELAARVLHDAFGLDREAGSVHVD